MSDADSDAKVRLREQIADLASKFLERSRVQAEKLCELNDRLRAGDASGIALIHEIAHKIHGSGAMFGFTAVSERAEQIERITQGLLGDICAPAPQISLGLAESIRQLTSAIEAAAAGRLPK